MPATAPLGHLLGEEVASAHPLPSDCWRVGADGGPPKRLTKIYSTALYGDFSPDGRYIVFISGDGVYLMNPDGTGLMRMLNGGLSGTVTWNR